MGGGSNNAADAANRREQIRLAQIRNTQDRVNNVFNSPQRAADIADFTNAMRTYYSQKLEQQKIDSDRNLTFALARNGVIGGSTDRDQHAEFARKYTDGLLDVDRRARGAGAELEAADQDARARLISLATTGLDATTAAQQASAAMRTNLEANKSTAMAQGIGDMFGQFKQFSDRAREAAERRRANQDAGFSLYGGGVQAWGRQ